LLALQRATHVTLAAVAEELADLHLGAAELNVLANLVPGETWTASELAAAAGSRPTTMTSVLDRLEARRLIRRRPHPADRRALRIELTADGRRAATAVRNAFIRVETRALAGLPVASVVGLRRALSALAGDGHGP
jgi:DNA-binding MarR family transcriptional regulator